MDETSPQLTAEEIAEIERHKYFLSEKAGYDVGWEFAQEDWKSKFAGDSGDRCKPASTATTAGRVGKFFKRLLSRAAI